MADEILLLTTDKNLTVVGDPIVHATSVEAVLRHNGVGSGQFTAAASRPLLDFLNSVAPGGDWLPDQIEPSYRIVLIRNHGIFCAGPIEQWNYTEDNDTNAGGTVTVTWAEDSAWLGARVTYPDPAAVAESQTAVARWTTTGNAEDLMRSLVNVNAGPGALVARRVPGLVMGTDHGVGSTVEWSTRFQPLADDLRALAVAGGGLGWRTFQDGAAIKFEVYQPQDLTGTVRFSRGLGNLRSASLTVSAPKVTAALVAGDGEGIARNIWERTSSTGVTLWGRYEQFVDQRGTADATELQQAGDQALFEGGETVRLETVTVDTSDQAYGTHYGLGDKVSIEVWPGREVADVVREVRLAWSAEGGTTITASVGSGEDSTDPLWVQRLRGLDRRLKRLEAI